MFFIVLFFSLILAKIKENIEPFGSKILKLPEMVQLFNLIQLHRLDVTKDNSKISTTQFNIESKSKESYHPFLKICLIDFSALDRSKQFQHFFHMLLIVQELLKLLLPDKPSHC